MFDKQSMLCRLGELSFPSTEYWVITGGAMVLYGFRPQTHDIDLGCTTALADQLEQQGYPVTRTADGSRKIAYADDVEIFENWLEGNLELVDGVPVVSVDGLIEMKRKLGREKDLADIALIEQGRQGQMRLLFEIDTKDYDPAGRAFVRPSARCIHIKNGLVAMVHSRKYDYYKFPGGGIDHGESRETAMIREAREEAGLVVIPASVREYGYVHRIKKSDQGDADLFVQDNYYYLCEVEEGIDTQKLDGYEAEEGFTLEYVDPDKAIFVNRNVDHGPKDQLMLEREAKVLELLKAEGYFRKKG